MVTVMAETAVTSLAPHFSSPPKKAKPRRVTTQNQKNSHGNPKKYFQIQRVL